MKKYGYDFAFGMNSNNNMGMNNMGNNNNMHSNYNSYNPSFTHPTPINRIHAITVVNKHILATTKPIT